MCQKNHGYALEHQYARSSWLAAKNYYQCLQIAHLINQLLVLSQTFQQHLIGKMTITYCWEMLRGFLSYARLNTTTLQTLAQQRIQIRFL